MVFIQGTGVRKRGCDQTMALLRKGLNDRLPVDIEGVCWGPDLGVTLDANAIEQVLPPSLMKTAETGPEQIGVRAALWAELLRDPLLELRLASMRPPAGKQNTALPGTGARHRTDEHALRFAFKVSDPLPGEVEAMAAVAASCS